MLFGHLASRFSTFQENLATEALAFILNRSEEMREALSRLVGRTGMAATRSNSQCNFPVKPRPVWDP
jgi:hypothetical protein